MTRLRLLCAATLLTAAASAQATSLVVTTDAIVGALRATSDATSDVTSSLRDDKIVRAARDDAASFVATDGAIRGVKLESAFDPIRRVAPQLQASDARVGPSHPGHLKTGARGGSTRSARRPWLWPRHCASLAPSFFSPETHAPTLPAASVPLLRSITPKPSI